MKTIRTLAFLIIITFLGFNCAKKTVTRVSADQQIDLSGRWNDTDAKLVAEEMIKDALGRNWRPEFADQKKKNPVIIVGMISNKSHEHIEAEPFIKSIEREFINSGLIRVVQNSVFREKLREERADQQEFASPETQKKWGRELGADFMMFGNINSIVDKEGNKKVNFYQVNVELANLETNEIVWIGEKKIKKYIKN
jgi:penicillin-binding protein activator